MSQKNTKILAQRTKLFVVKVFLYFQNLNPICIMHWKPLMNMANRQLEKVNERK